MKQVKKIRSRAYEADGRAKAFAAARLAIKDGLSLIEAARRGGSNRCSAGEAFLILHHGTEAEIASVESNRVAMGTLVRAIRARVPLADRSRKPGLKNNEQLHGIAFDAAIWAKLRDALDGINSLPHPKDVMTIVHKNRVREEMLNKKLIAAYGWITEFSDAWTQ